MTQEFISQAENIGFVVVCVVVLAILSFLLEPLIKKIKMSESKIIDSQPPIKTETSSKTTAANSISSQDIKAIAGDDVMTTQLDLARAYIEMGKKQLAKKILQHVKDNGNSMQQDDAQQLMQNL